MNTYLIIKQLHVGLALVSILWFVGRAVPVIAADRRSTTPWLRVAPHVLDTLLLATGVTLAVQAGWRPGAHPWLAAKLYLLVLYIGFAWVALKPWLPRPWRWAAFGVACLVFVWMLLVAVSKSPLGPVTLAGG